MPWPQSGWRPIISGTGDEGGVVEDFFVLERRGEIQYATNRAAGRSYITGWYVDPATAAEDREAADTSRIYTHEANYHPDGGQIFCPRDSAAFVAFYCDGTFGIYIDPIVWQQPVYLLSPSAVFDDRRGRVHACVAIDFVSEFGCYLEVPLSAPRPS